MPQLRKGEEAMLPFCHCHHRMKKQEQNLLWLSVQSVFNLLKSIKFRYIKITCSQTKVKSQKEQNMVNLFIDCDNSSKIENSLLDILSFKCCLTRVPDCVWNRSSAQQHKKHSEKWGNQTCRKKIGFCQIKQEATPKEEMQISGQDCFVWEIQ